MKTKNLTWTSMIVAIMLFAFTACNSGNENNAANEAEDMEMGEGMNGQHMEGMDMGQQEGAAGTATTNVPVLNSYLDIKNALVKDYFDQAKQAAADFQKTLEESDKISAAQKKELKGSAGKVAQAKDIASMRENFSALSQQLYQVVQANNDLTDQTLYWQHCPMAMNNKGANWLSLEEKVQNPFMGQKMPGCGSVQETL